MSEIRDAWGNTVAPSQALAWVELWEELTSGKLAADKAAHDAAVSSVRARIDAGELTLRALEPLQARGRQIENRQQAASQVEGNLKNIAPPMERRRHQQAVQKSTRLQSESRRMEGTQIPELKLAIEKMQETVASMKEHNNPQHEIDRVLWDIQRSEADLQTLEAQAAKLKADADAANREREASNQALIAAAVELVKRSTRPGFVESLIGSRA